MDKIVITGGRRLNGDVVLSGSKNSALPIMAAALLAEDTTVISNVQNLRDIQTMIKLLRALGAKASFEDGRVVIKPGKELNPVAPYKLVSTMRASV